MADDRAAEYLLGEARRLVVRQEADLDELRDRASKLLTFASVAAAIFAAATVKYRSGVSTAALVAVFVAFAAMVWCLLAVLRSRDWFFSEDLSGLIDHVATTDTSDPEVIAISLADKLDKNRVRNVRQLRCLHNWFGAACALLGVQVLAWLIVIM